MSISGSLSNALTGLTASSRAAELVSSNVANAMTEGYGRREIELSSRVTGGRGAGVTVDGVARIVDQAVLRDRRLADADAANATVPLQFFEDLEALVGVPGEVGSLSARISDLEGALIEAASRPDLTARLDAVVRTANELTRGLNAASDGIQSLRVDADAEIARTVEDVNANLARIADVNALILRNTGAGRDVSALLDQRQQLVDRISEVVPLRVFPRDNGTIALYSTTGAMLLDVTPAMLSFSPTATITADMTIGSGALSGLEINGNPISTSGQFSPIGGGKLAALFSVRDELATEAQSRLDSVARDLIDRVATPAVDPTLLPGDPGFFTDAGGAFDPLNEIGLAGRILVNAAVDPSSGGDLWRLRDGIAAVAQGPAGNNSGLVALANALSAERLPLSGDVATVARSAAGLLGDFSSLIGADIRDAEASVGYTAARLESLRDIELGQGVDTDQEMQKLLLIEKVYAANAQVIRTADEMIQMLLGL